MKQDLIDKKNELEDNHFLRLLNKVSRYLNELLVALHPLLAGCGGYPVPVVFEAVGGHVAVM